MPKKAITPAKGEQKDPVAGAINQLASAIRQLDKNNRDGFDKLETILVVNTKKAEEPKVIEPAISDITEEKPMAEGEVDIPFPQEWREVINEVLNAEFGASVKYLSAANFELTINVPREYSNATPKEWEMYKADRRIKIMPNYLGIAGVKEYAELVAKQLGPEIRAKIAEGRSKLNNI